MHVRPCLSRALQGLASLNTKDASAPAPGARAAMCLAVQPFGALSLKSTMPFEMQDGVLGFYIRSNSGNGNSSSNSSGSSAAAAAGGLGRLELVSLPSLPRCFPLLAPLPTA